jgi:hypothetical protein
MKRIAYLFCIALAVQACGSDSDDDTGTPAADIGVSAAEDMGAAAPDMNSPVEPTEDAGAPVGDPDSGASPRPVDPDEGDPQPYDVPAVLSATSSEPEPGQQPGCGGTTVSEIRGWVVDRIGRPIDAAKAQLCVVDAMGTTNCLRPADSGPDGVFSIVIGDDYRCLGQAAFRVIKPGSGRAPMYCNAVLPEPSGNTKLTFEDPFVLYAGIAAEVLPPVGDEMSELTVKFANGVELDVILFDLVSPYAELGMRTVGTDERGLCFLDAGQTPPAKLYAFSPDSTIYGEAKIRFPNDLELAAGSQVDVSILGGLGCERNGEHIAEGAWTSIGTGTVNADGTMIVPDEGTALTCLTWIGYTPL